MSDTMFGVGELPLSPENREKGSKKDGRPLSHSLFFKGVSLRLFQGG